MDLAAGEIGESPGHGDKAVGVAHRDHTGVLIDDVRRDGGAVEVQFAVVVDNLAGGLGDRHPRPGVAAERDNQAGGIGEIAGQMQGCAVVEDKFPRARQGGAAGVLKRGAAADCELRTGGNGYRSGIGEPMDAIDLDKSIDNVEIRANGVGGITAEIEVRSAIVAEIDGDRT